MCRRALNVDVLLGSRWGDVHEESTATIPEADADVVAESKVPRSRTQPSAGALSKAHFRKCGRDHSQTQSRTDGP